MAPAPEPQYFEVSDVARLCNVADVTVRWWEREGLIRPPARTAAGRRIFTRADVEEIQRARADRAAARQVGRAPVLAEA
jgi:DNA-binding transcriptional MerR regulator